MSLSIKVSNDDGRPFYPGSLVPGVVELVLYDDQPIGELAINFSGRANVLLVHSYGDMTTSRRDFKSVGYIFSQHLNLYQGKYTHRKGRYMWPFAFRIPLSAAPRALSPESADFFHPERPWKSDYKVELHPLPPSFSHGGRFLCFVEYTLHASLVRPSRTPISLSRNLSAVKAVQVEALAQEPDLELHGDWPYTTYRHSVRYTLGKSHRIVPEFLRPNLRQGQRRFRSITTRKAELHLSVLLPKSTILKKQATLPILVAATSHAINSDNESLQNSEPGHVHDKNLVIKSFKVSLVQLTQVRAGCHRASSEKRVFVWKGSCVVPLSGSPSLLPGHLGVGNQDTGATVFVNLADIADLTIPNTTLTPEFSTYNIAHSHSLEVLLKMEYANKSFKFHLRRIPIRVLSSEYHGLGQNEIRQSAREDAWIVPPQAEESVDALFADPPPCYRT